MKDGRKNHRAKSIKQVTGMTAREHRFSIGINELTMILGVSKYSIRRYEKKGILNKKGDGIDYLLSLVELMKNKGI